MERSQFTWYRSYYEALKTLPAKEFKSVVLAVCAYALDEEAPSLSGVSNSVFTLIRPTLDSGRNKAANRINKQKSNAEQTNIKTEQTDIKRKTNREQTEIKTEQNGKEKERENEKERDIEKESESENDSSPPYPPLDRSFEKFWAAYPRKIHRTEAEAAWKRLNPKPALETILASLEAHRKSADWQKENGRYIPAPDNWLVNRRWRDTPPPAGSEEHHLRYARTVVIDGVEKDVYE